jgi:three-Cys-motif partner protein
LTSSKDHFSTPFEDHTLLKHAFLNGYLLAWAFKLLQWGQGGDRVYYVDGFAGAGHDPDGKPGSPTIACRIAQMVKAKLADVPGKESCRMVIFAVEKEATYFSELERHLTRFARSEPDGLFLRQGKFAEHFNEIAARVALCPTLYFLDPFGIRGLEASAFPRMLAGPSNEIFVLFSDTGAVRLRGLFHADDSDIDEQIAALQQTPSLFAEHDAADQAALAAEAERRRQARQPTLPAAVDALSRAIDDESWMEEMAEFSSEEAAREFLLRFVKKLIAAGAQFVQVIQMRDAAGVHKHCLVHASKSVSGFTAMKAAVSAGLNRKELSEEMRSRMRDDLRLPIDEVCRVLSEKFAGQEVSWTDQVKRFLLDETGIYDSQCKEIKARLRADSVWSRKGHREICTFPARSDGG